MIIDSSALIAVLFDQPKAGRMIKALVADSKRLMSSISVLETAVIMQTKKGPAAGRELDLFLHEAQIEIIHFTADLMKITKEAYFKFRTEYHDRFLDMGDCSAYALAKYSGEPLLFEGTHFLRTDVVAVVF